MTKIEPSWDFYRTFLAVLNEGSLSGAARVLGLTQPTVGRHIDALETAIGFQLFTRSQHGLSATPAALELRPYAETLSSAAASLLRTASEQGGCCQRNGAGQRQRGRRRRNPAADPDGSA